MILRNAIRSGLGPEAVIDESRSPICCTVPREKFADAAKVMKKAFALLAAEWVADESPFGRGFGIYACYRWGTEYLIVRTDVPYDDPVFPSLVRTFVPALRFERQISSLMGVSASGNPDRRPWIKFEDWPEDAWPLRKSFDISTRMARTAGDYAWIKAEGEGVYEIPVGPVHAGIIEPGHFRFQAVGEDVINLEERLGYVHKGIEKKFETLSWQDAAILAGRISGDATVAHSLAYCRAFEDVADCSVPQRAHWLRALFLERERIANHLWDLGMICNDAAFAFILYQFSILREKILRTNHKLSGHRFLMDKVVPGGVAADIDGAGIEEIRGELSLLEKEFERLVSLYEENPSLEDRVKTTGVLSPEKAREICAVGIVARASGLNLDCRSFSPFPPYTEMEISVPVLIAGDVDARARVRIGEIRESIRIIREILDTLPGGPVLVTPERPLPDRTGFAAVEGWRGEIICWVQSGPNGEINRCMVRDPSGVNWIGLEQAIHGNIVPDFPLCNKSFNQSYSGNDL